MAKKKPQQQAEPQTADERIEEIKRLLDGVTDINADDFYVNLSAALFKLSQHIKHDGSKGIHLDNVSVVLCGAAREVDKIANKAIKPSSAKLVVMKAAS